MHLFNPPAPHCSGHCGNCACSPKYWLFEFDSYLGTDFEGNPLIVPEFKTILKHEEVGFSFLGGGGFPYPISLGECFWGVRTRSGAEPELHLEYTTHDFYAPWYLYFDDTLPGDTKWRVRLVASGSSYAEWLLVPGANGSRHFKCLSANDFLPSPGDSTLVAWEGTSLPPALRLTPLYP